MGSLTVTQIADRVNKAMGDEQAAQFTINHVINWVNDALREICLQNELLQVKATASTTAGTAAYNFPADLLKLVSLAYKGQHLTHLSFQQARELIPNIDDASSYPVGQCEYFWTWAGQFQVYPAPDNTGSNLTIYYLQNPTVVTSGPDIPVTPPQYDNRIVEYCIAQASDMDDNSPKYQQKINEFRENVRTQADNDSPVEEYYPFITDLPGNQIDFQGSWF